MKLIALNCWGGNQFGELIEFINQNKETTDIFCLQEIFSTTTDKRQYKNGRLNLLQELSAVLSNFSYEFAPMMNGAFFAQQKVDFNLEYGLVIFYKDKLKKIEYKDRAVFNYKLKMENGEEKAITTKLQLLKLTLADKEHKPLNIMNFHGTAFPSDKLDNDERLTQSKVIVEELNKKTREEVILTGDFNLLPTTNCITMIDNQLSNLIKTFKISQTRSILTGFRGKEGEQPFADYTFTSTGIIIDSFEVPDIAISDHLPMILNFNW